MAIEAARAFISLKPRMNKRSACTPLEWARHVITEFSSVRTRARGLLGRNDLQRQDFSELSEMSGGPGRAWLAKKDGYLMGQLEGSPAELDGEVLPD